MSIHTGRTHQIRVHGQHIGYPVAGDEKYGDAAFNQLLKTFGLKRLFLHACAVRFTLPSRAEPIEVEAPLSEALHRCLARLREDG